MDKKEIYQMAVRFALDEETEEDKQAVKLMNDDDFQLYLQLSYRFSTVKGMQKK